MRELSTPLYRVRLAQDDADLHRAQALRQRAFRGLLGRDSDRFDATASHILVQDRAGQVLATFRFAVFDAGDDLHGSYAASFYDLRNFAAQQGHKAEVGRFCLHPDVQDPDVLRLAFAALARLTTEQSLAHIFGCSSLPGADPAPHAASLAWLHDTALGPPDLCPSPIAPQALPMAGKPGDDAGLPALLRFYLGLGAWVADHAMLDHDLDTLHVFTALDLTRLTPTAAKMLQHLAR